MTIGNHVTGTEVASRANGGTMACFLGAGVGAFAIGAIVLLKAGLFIAPTLYGPAGGVSGRTTLAAVVWLVAWVVLHHVWKARHLPPSRVYLLPVTLIALGILGTFPPLWRLL